MKTPKDVGDVFTWNGVWSRVVSSYRYLPERGSQAEACRATVFWHEPHKLWFATMLPPGVFTVAEIESSGGATPQAALNAEVERWGKLLSQLPPVERDTTEKSAISPRSMFQDQLRDYLSTMERHWNTLPEKRDPDQILRTMDTLFTMIVLTAEHAHLIDTR